MRVVSQYRFPSEGNAPTILLFRVSTFHHGVETLIGNAHAGMVFIPILLKARDASQWW